MDTPVRFTVMSIEADYSHDELKIFAHDGMSPLVSALVLSAMERIVQKKERRIFFSYGMGCVSVEVTEELYHIIGVFYLMFINKRPLRLYTDEAKETLSGYSEVDRSRLMR